VQVGAPEQVNLAPVIESVYQPSDSAISGESLTFALQARDPEGQALTFAWTADAGTLGAAVTNGGTSEVQWTAPAAGGPVVVQAVVTFGGGPLVSGAYSAFLAKFDASGVHQWSKLFGTGADLDATGYTLALDSGHNIVMGGPFHGTVDFGGGPLVAAGSGNWDVFVAKFASATGAHLQSVQYGDSSLQSLSDIAIDSSNRIVGTGTFAGSIDFGNGPLTSSGGWDTFVAKLSL
jgi:hypothetical protein